MAIKVFLPDSAEADPHGRQRLRREALTACRLNHPNLVHVYDCGRNVVVVEDEDGTYRYDELYVAMELLDGQTLRDNVRQVGRLPLRQIRLTILRRGSAESSNNNFIVQLINAPSDTNSEMRYYIPGKEGAFITQLREPR